MSILNKYNKTLAEVSRDYIELYRIIDFNLECEKSKLLNIMNELGSSIFIKCIQIDYKHYVEEIFDALNEAHGTSTKLSMPLNLNTSSLHSEFELTIFYIIACGITIYEQPEYFTAAGEKAGLLEQIKPNSSVIIASKKLQAAIKKQGLNVGEWKLNLMKLANGNPILTQLQPIKDPLERMIQEIMITSKPRLIIRNKGKGRFSAQAIIAISKIVQHKPIPDIRKIQRIQRKLEEINDASNFQVTSNIENI